MDINGFIKRVGIDGHEALAKKIGSTKKAVDSWSAGDRSPTFEMAYRLKKLGMSNREMFGEEFPVDMAPSESAFDARVERITKRMLEDLGIVPGNFSTDKEKL